MPMPRIYVIDSPQPNAFATGRNPKHAAAAVTTGILELMNHAELEGVLAHELAHVRNRDILIGTIAATMAAALTFIGRIALFGGGRRDNNPLGFVALIASIIVLPFAAMMVRSAISRSREYQADRSGAEITGSPQALASALAKLEAGTNRIPMQVNPAVSQLFIADPMASFRRRGRQPRGSMGGALSLFSTHPPIAERIERLERMAMGIR
jgi:heat shock protein HtpX